MRMCISQLLWLPGQLNWQGQNSQRAAAATCAHCRHTCKGGGPLPPRPAASPADGNLQSTAGRRQDSRCLLLAKQRECR